MAVPSPTTPLIACINTSLDLVHFLRDVVIEEGHRAVPYVITLDQRQEELTAFLSQLRPQAVIYAVSFPYEESWHTFQTIRASFPEFGWVVTTTNKHALDQWVGSTDAVEIIGKPFDLDHLITAFRRAVTQATA